MKGGKFGIESKDENQKILCLPDILCDARIPI